ncbi:hypothetical protein PG989_002160 [Apiospora arundinis]
MITPPTPPARTMVPSHLPKLTIYQPAWFEEKKARDREAETAFRREMAVKKLRSVYDLEEINEYLELEDDDPLIDEVLLDIGLEPGVDAESLHQLLSEFYVLEEEVEEEEEEVVEVYSTEEDEQSDEYYGDYYGQTLDDDSGESQSEHDSLGEYGDEEEAGYYTDNSDILGETY